MCKAYRAGPVRRHATDPVGRAAEIVGDRWSPLVLADLRAGPRSYGALHRDLVGISTNALADRLAALVAAGVVRRVPTRVLAPRGGYALTAKGRALLEVVDAMARWAETHRPVRIRRRGPIATVA